MKSISVSFKSRLHGMGDCTATAQWAQPRDSRRLPTGTRNKQVLAEAVAEALAQSTQVTDRQTDRQRGRLADRPTVA